MKKSYFSGVRIPWFVAFILLCCSCKKEDTKTQNGGGGNTLTLSITPGVNINIPYGGTASFTPVTNGVKVTVDGNVVVGTFTSAPLTVNRDYVVVSYSSTNTDALSTSTTVHVTVDAPPPPPPNPKIALISNLPWVCSEFDARPVDSVGTPLGTWYPLSKGCDTVKFNLTPTYRTQTNRGSCNGTPTVIYGNWDFLNNYNQLDWGGAVWNISVLNSSLMELQCITKALFSNQWTEYRKRYVHP